MLLIEGLLLGCGRVSVHGPVGNRRPGKTGKSELLLRGFPDQQALRAHRRSLRPERASEVSSAQGPTAGDSHQIWLFTLPTL